MGIIRPRPPVVAGLVAECPRQGRGGEAIRVASPGRGSQSHLHIHHGQSQ